MNLDLLDWSIIAIFLAGILGLGVLFARRAGGGMVDFFLAGRNLPWWLAGTSMVATSFAADTPLMVSGFIRTGGIWENWFWWSAALGGMVTVVFYARLWRRAAFITDIQFIETRYAGPAATSLRLFLAVYAGALTNCIAMGTVMLAMSKLGGQAFGWPESIAVGGFEISGKLLLLTVLMGVVLVYTITAGMWGVVATDFIEFIIAMLGAIVLMIIVYIELGGPAQMVERITAAPGVTEDVFAFIPTPENAGSAAFFTFIVYISVQWWASSTGTSSNNQRLLATRDERQATYAMLWGTFAHYVIRPWPWIVVGLASLVYFPLTPGEDPEAAYPRMMMELLPTGFRGLMVVAFLAAFMSTIDTRLNWGASYLVNDIYQRFLRPDADPKHYVLVSRVLTFALLCGAGLAAFYMESIVGAWMYLIKLGAGAGLVVLLRWFWWRINAWSEISALAASFVIATAIEFIPGIAGRENYALQLVIVVVGSTVVWLVVTFLTPPTKDERLESFFRTVRPGGWWGPIAARHPDIQQDAVSRGIPAWFTGLLMIYAGLFGLGYICLGEYAWGFVGLAVAGASAYALKRSLNLIIHTPETPGSPEAPATVTPDPR